MGKRKIGPRPELELEIQDTTYPGIGVAYQDEKVFHVKKTFPGQIIRGRYLKNKQGIGQIQVLEQIRKATWEVTPSCNHYERCGGCMSQEVPYEMQLHFKEKEVLEMFQQEGLSFEKYHGIEGSPQQFRYRNKMEYTFGDEFKNGPLCLGLHVQSRKNSILTVDQCQIVPEDFNRLLRRTLDYFSRKGIPYYWPLSHKGTLRSLILREGKRTGELMAILVTASDDQLAPEEWAEDLKQTETSGTLTSIFHITNNSLQDAVVAEKIDLLYGREYITEELCGLKFRITPMSFFQTSTEAAEHLYGKVAELAGNLEKKTVFDLYCGTGTIGNILAKKASHVTGVEIIEEAARIAQTNSEVNGINNTDFIAGDVREVLKDLKESPDLIVLDPPRAGLHPKALEYALDFRADEIIYVSCNPRTLATDLQMMQKTMALKELLLLDNYPNTNHVEAIVLMSMR